MAISSNPLDEDSVWELLGYTRQVVIVLLCITIAITIVFAVASPIPAVYYWYTSGSSDGQIAYPYFIGLTDNVCWLTYGIYKHDWGIIALNIYCVSMTTSYITVMYIYRKNRTDMNRLIIVWVLVAIILQGILAQQETSEEAAKLVGRFTVCIQTFGASGLVYLMYKIFKSWRLDFVPFFPVALGLSIEAQVFTLGVLKQDPYLMMANGFFLTMNIILFALFYILPADRQLVLPDLFTFLYYRAMDIKKWYQDRRIQEKKTAVYSTPSSTVVDFNENELQV